MAAGLVSLDWDEAAVEAFFHAPESEIETLLLMPAAVYVADQAKRLALRRTGTMAAEIHAEPGTDEVSVYADIVSPVFYARFHEGRKTRDRRPHRSLVPALTTIRFVFGE